MMAALTIAVMDPDVCCGRNSALEDQAASAGTSLKELGEKLRGKHYLDGGLPFSVADQFWSGASVNAENIVSSLIEQHPLLMQWNDHVFVVYGAEFDEYKSSTGSSMHVIRKLLLVDTRFSDGRRCISFNRQTDDWSKVTGLLALTITR
jgi:hypothetical protein